jgi:DNA-directed RNA polymerase subunit H (RpoH/RPB5)
VPGPASGVPKKEVRRRKEEEWTEERILTTYSISFESVPSVLNLDSVVSALRKKKPYKPTVTSMRAQ